MNIFRTIVVASLLVLSIPATAQVVLSGGEVHVGDGVVIEGGDVVIGADGKIAGVGTNVAAPSNATVIDVSGKIVTPGLIDISTGLGLTEIWAVKRTRDADPGTLDHERDQIRSAFRAADAFNPMGVAIPVTRVNGVTSVVTLPSGGLISGQGAWIDLAGELGHATVVEPSVAMKATAGSSGGRTVGGSRGSAILLLRETLEDARFWQQNQARFDENRSRGLAASRLDFAALGPVLAGEQPLYFDVDKASDILAVLALAREYGVRPIISGGAEAWMVAEELARDGVSVIVEPTANMPWTFDMLGARSDNAALLAAAGVPVVISTFDAHNVRNLRYQVGNAIRAGLDPAAALTTVTKNAAEAVGMGASHGTLEPGKAGNVVIWSGDPFQFSAAPESVWVGGEEQSMQTRQTKLFQRYRTLERRADPAEREPASDEGGQREAAGDKDVESDD